MLAWPLKTVARYLPVVVRRAVGSSPSVTNRDTGSLLRSARLLKSDILRGYGVFGRVLTGGRRFHVGPLKFFFQIESQIPPFDCMVGFAFRKAPCAVSRNRARRILREAYRLTLPSLRAFCWERECNIRCVIMYDFSRTPGIPALDNVLASFRTLLERASSETALPQ